MSSPVSSVRAIDVHTHLDFPIFDADRDAVLERAQRAGVERVLIAAADPAHWTRVRSVAHAIGAPYALGIHPWWESDLSDEAVFSLLLALSSDDIPDAYGECGLDFRVGQTPRARTRQAQTTAAHIALADERRRPVIFHVVRAYPQFLTLLRKHPVGAAGGMVHSWSGDARHVEPALRQGLYLSFGTAVLKSERVAAALHATPLERLLLESDCPDQPITPGTRNEPIAVLEVARKAAQIKGVALETVLTHTTENANALFPALRDQKL